MREHATHFDAAIAQQRGYCQQRGISRHEAAAMAVAVDLDEHARQLAAGARRLRQCFGLLEAVDDDGEVNALRDQLNARFRAMVRGEG